MRGKRSKQYRKLMQQYALTFNFREPYQVLVDAQMIQDTYRFRMDLAPALSRTLHGEVKPMITQCSIRHLFALSTTPAVSSSSSSTATRSDEKPATTQAEKTALLEISRSCTLRRCNHHTLPNPLSTLDCYRSVLDPKDQGTNKHCYVLAVQDESVRSWARGIKGVPTIYVKRSVMVMEPMASASVGVREREEKGKLRGGVRKGLSVGSATTGAGGEGLGKRKRDELEDDDEEEGESSQRAELMQGQVKKKKKSHGLKGPNPLSVKKKKKVATSDMNGDVEAVVKTKKQKSAVPVEGSSAETEENKKKRRRKHKSSSSAEPGGNSLIQALSTEIEVG